MWKWTDMQGSEELRARPPSNRESPGASVNRTGINRKPRHSTQGGTRRHRKSVHKGHRKRHTRPDKEIVVPVKPLVEYDDVSSDSSFFAEPPRDSSVEKRSSPEFKDLRQERRRNPNRPDMQGPMRSRKRRSKDKHQIERRDRNRDRVEKLPSRSGSRGYSSVRERSERDSFAKDRASTSKDNSFVRQQDYPLYDYERSKEKNKVRKRVRTPETPRAYRTRTPSPVKNTQMWVNKSRRRSPDNRNRLKYVSKSPSPFPRNYSAWSKSRSRSKSPLSRNKRLRTPSRSYSRSPLRYRHRSQRSISRTSTKSRSRSSSPHRKHLKRRKRSPNFASKFASTLVSELCKHRKAKKHRGALIIRNDTVLKEPDAIPENGNTCPRPSSSIAEFSDNSLSSTAFNPQEILLPPEGDVPQEECDHLVEETSVLSNSQTDSAEPSITASIEDEEAGISKTPELSQDSTQQLSSTETKSYNPPLPTLPPLPLPPVGPEDENLVDEEDEADLSPLPSPEIEKKPTTPPKKGIKDLPLPPGIKEEDILSPEAEPEKSSPDMENPEPAATFQSSTKQILFKRSVEHPESIPRYRRNIRILNKK
ncbi:cyclin-dependent kinase 13 [Trichonephila clavata]|uniref:Cyclin-dependent kinase 13 n=1 Tax=Trichonephila clavata TaxID=2740835 RepID=A0A8X6GIG0_TRICU|nr:cyclin-dependent kinase 13 [Trichonephila clavata]